MSAKFFIFFILFVPVVGFCQTISDRLKSNFSPQDVPMELPKNVSNVQRVPNELKQTNFFGEIKHPDMEYYDPYDSARTKEGRDTLSEQLPVGRVLEDMSHRQLVRFGSQATVPVTFGRPVAVLLMKDGKVVFPPKTSIVGVSDQVLEVTVVPGSPYIYFQIKQNVVFPDNYPYTDVFIPVVIDGRPFQYQIRLEVVSPRSPKLVPLNIVDLVDGADSPEYSPAFSPKGAANNSSKGSSNQKSVSEVSSDVHFSQTSKNEYEMGSSSAVPLRPPFSRDVFRPLISTMLEMVQLYQSAVRDHAHGYTPEDIVRSRVSSIKDGTIVRDSIPAFRNPNDSQLYAVPWVYYFRKYDTLIYQMEFQNKTERSLWFDYSLLRMVLGFDGVETARAVTVASPGKYESTPSGESNIVWVVLQGQGVMPSTPVRFMFPPSGFGQLRPRVSDYPSVSPKSSGGIYKEGELFLP